MPAGSRSAAQTAGGRKKDEIWDLVKNVEKVITKSGKATSEKRWVCKFCDRTLQGGPNIIMAHHGVHGSGKKKDVHRCRHTPPDVKARLEQEMSNILRSVAEKEASSVIKCVREEEEHVQRIEDAGIDTSVLVATGQLKLAFQRAPRTSQSTSASSASTVSAGESSGSSSTVNNELLDTAADTVQSRKQSADSKVSLIPTLTKKYSEVIARELDEAISAGCIAAGVPPSAHFRLTHVLTLCLQTMTAPCFARTSTHSDTARPASGMRRRSKRSSTGPGKAFRSFSLTPLESA